MILASSVDLGKSDALTNLADDLTDFVRRAAQDGSSLDDLERGVFQRLLEMGHAAVDLFLNAQGDGDARQTHFKHLENQGDLLSIRCSFQPACV